MAKTQPESDQIDEVKSAADETSAPETRWTLSFWGVYPQWRCLACPFDTLDGEDAMLEHWRGEHAPPAPVVVPPVIQVYDRWGNPK